MSGTTFFFFAQQEGKESRWELELAAQRDEIVAQRKPAFTTVLDLSGVPDDNDWSKVRYRGPFYADFDDEDDIEFVIQQFAVFLIKLEDDYGFDLKQARLYATGKKGLHIEIPPACFMPKVPESGTPWLPYVYRAMAESLVVDTLDINVYTGKRGRQWRTSNVRRENGAFKVPISLEDALSLTPALYEELCSVPRAAVLQTPPTINAKLAALYERSRDKVTTQMRGKKKRQERSNAVLDPWKKSGKTPPTLEKLMAGERVNKDAGFHQIAMQLAIYATSVGMPLVEFLDRCKGLCENHVSDSRRYGTPSKRRDELQRMWEYMESDSLYDFDPAPIGRLMEPGTPMPDLGVRDQEDYGDRPAKPKIVEGDVEDGDSVATPTDPEFDEHKGVRRGFFTNGDGMWKKEGDNVNSVCRASMRYVDAYYGAEEKNFQGYEFDLCVAGVKRKRLMLPADAFVTQGALRKFFAHQQIGFQGTESDAIALLDVMQEKAERGGKVYAYPREGFFVMNHPERDKVSPVKVYLTRDTYIASVNEGEPDYFRMQYRPTAVTSAFNIDVHRAPNLDESMRDSLRDIFAFSKPSLIADVMGWFIAAHYRSLYLHLFNQFPLLQVYGEAGSGKTQTVELMAHLHWYMKENISVKSAMAGTAFAVEAGASSSTSAPLILDEYKPREGVSVKGRYEKLKDIFKASYVGSTIGERGTVNRGAENHLALISTKATSPIVFMSEAIETETAIIERSVVVSFSKSQHSDSRKAAFERLQQNPEVLSSLGREIIQAGFSIDLEKMREELRGIVREIEKTLPSFDDENAKRVAPRIVYNRAVIVQALRILKRILQRRFGNEFDEACENLISSRDAQAQSEEAKVLSSHGMSEISKVMSRIALCTRDRDVDWAMKFGIDYVTDDGWVEIMVERSYDKYRRYCASIHDTPLFDNLDAFTHALNAYSPVIDRMCARSSLRDDESTERIVRMSVKSLRREGVQAFKSN